MNSLAVSGFRITGNLNEGIGDVYPGSPKAGTIAGAVGALGQLGANVFITAQELVNYTNPAGTITVLYGGWYKYVKFKATWSATMAAGQPLFYGSATDFDAVTVTPDAAAAAIFAGYCLAPGITKGNYWWIQTGGIATVLCKSTVTTTTAGDIAVQTDGTTATIDAIADATDYYTTALKGGKLFRGQFIDAPANAALKRILMAPISPFQ